MWFLCFWGSLAYTHNWRITDTRDVCHHHQGTFLRPQSETPLVFIPPVSESRLYSHLHFCLWTKPSCSSLWPRTQAQGFRMTTGFWNYLLTVPWEFHLLNTGWEPTPVQDGNLWVTRMPCLPKSSNESQLYELDFIHPWRAAWRMKYRTSQNLGENGEHGRRCRIFIQGAFNLMLGSSVCSDMKGHFRGVFLS